MLEVVGALIIVAGSCISGMRLHRWAYYNTAWGWRLPPDIGAWIGLAVGIGLLQPLQFFPAFRDPPGLVDYSSHPTIKCLLADEPTLTVPGEFPGLCP